MRETLGLLASGDPSLDAGRREAPTESTTIGRPRSSSRPTGCRRSCSGRRPPTARRRRRSTSAVDDRSARTRPRAARDRARLRSAPARCSSRSNRSGGRSTATAGPTARTGSPLRASADAWRRDGSPVDANARALGIDPAAVEPWLRAILATWRDSRRDRHRSSRGTSATRRGRSAARSTRRAVAAPSCAGSTTPTTPRSEPTRTPSGSTTTSSRDRGRGPVPVAFMLDVEIPRRTPAGWTTGEQWVVAELRSTRASPTSASSSTRPATPSTRGRSGPDRAFAVMREEHTTLIEALGDIVAWDLYEPAWQAALPRAVGAARGRPAGPLRRCRPRRRLVAVRDRPPSDARSAPRTTSGPRSRSSTSASGPAPRVVVVGGPRPARPDSRLHGQLRARGDRHGRPARSAARAPRRLARRRSRAGTTRSARRSTAGAASATPSDILDGVPRATGLAGRAPRRSAPDCRRRPRPPRLAERDRRPGRRPRPRRTAASGT